MRGDSRGEEYSYNLHFLHSFSFSLQLPPLTLYLPHFPSLSPILHSFILPSPFQFLFPNLLLFSLPLPPAPPSPFFFPLFSPPLLPFPSPSLSLSFIFHSHSHSLSLSAIFPLLLFIPFIPFLIIIIFNIT